MPAMRGFAAIANHLRANAWIRPGRCGTLISEEQDPGRSPASTRSALSSNRAMSPFFLLEDLWHSIEKKIDSPCRVVEGHHDMYHCCRIVVVTNQ
jgi:hypothetical protein